MIQQSVDQPSKLHTDHIPCSNWVFSPRGAFVASWSNVMISPPFWRIRALAFSVKFKAQTRSLGILWMRLSSVTVPTITAIFSDRPGLFICMLWIQRNKPIYPYRYWFENKQFSLTNFDREIGGLLVRLIHSLLRMILLNLASVRRAKNR